MIAVNLGSGQRKFHSVKGVAWINVDINPKWEPDIVADGASMPMFEDASVDLVVCHHTLEHYGCGEANAMIQECNRILKPGGSLIVCVPDMYELARAWFDGRLTDQVYFTSVYGAFMDSEADRHRWGFTGKSLAATLRSATEWSMIKPFDWRTIPGADIAKDFWILGMESIK